MRINSSTAPLSVKETSKMLASVQKEKDEAITSRQYEFAAELRDREANLQEKLGSLEKGQGVELIGNFLKAGVELHNVGFVGHDFSL